MESHAFVRLLDKSKNVPQWILRECLLGCLSVQENIILYELDPQLYNEKLAISLRVASQAPPPFKSLAVTISTCHDHPSKVSDSIVGVCLELAIIHYPDDYLKYKDSLSKAWLKRHKTIKCKESDKHPDILSQCLFKLQKELHCLNREREALLSDNCALKERIELSEQAALKNTQINSEQAALIGELESKLTGCSGQIQKLVTENNQMQIDLSSLKEDLDKRLNLDLDLQSTQVKLDQAVNENARLHSKYEQVCLELADKTAKLASLVSIHEQQAIDNCEERKKIASQFAEYKKRTMQEKLAASEELALATIKNKQLVDELSSLKELNSSTEQTVKEQQHMLHDLKCQLELKNEQLKQRSKGLDEYVHLSDEGMDNDCNNIASSSFIDLLPCNGEEQ